MNILNIEKSLMQLLKKALEIFLKMLNFKELTHAQYLWEDNM